MIVNAIGNYAEWRGQGKKVLSCSQAHSSSTVFDYKYDCADKGVAQEPMLARGREHSELAKPDLLGSCTHSVYALHHAVKLLQLWLTQMFCHEGVQFLYVVPRNAPALEQMHSGFFQDITVAQCCDLCQPTTCLSVIPDG